MKIEKTIYFKDIIGVYVPRYSYDMNKIKQMSESIKRLGLMQNIGLNRTPKGLMLIWGSRRLKALKELGITQIPSKKYNVTLENVKVLEVSDKVAMEMAMVENEQNEDNPVIQKAYLYKKHLDKYNLKAKDLAKVLGVSRSRVAHIVSILKNVNPKILEQESVKSADMHTYLSYSMFEELMKLKKVPHIQLIAYQTVKKEGLTLKALKDLLRKLEPFGIKQWGHEELKVGKKWINLGVMMDTVMRKDFLGNLRFHIWKELGENATKKERDKFTEKYCLKLVEEMKPNWIEYKRISKDGYPMANWDMTDKEIEKELFPNKKIPIPSVLKGID